jgi:hypothetical protein
MSTAPPSLSGLEKNQEETYVAVLEALGELRPDWINNPKYMYRTILIYAPLM